MNGTVNLKEESTTDSINKSRSREVSKYSYPYYDLETAIEVAKMLFNQAGGKASLAQLASYLGHKDETSGAFIAKVWGAKLFGLVKVESQTVLISPLGERLSSLETGVQRDIRMTEAFLNVPLFHEVYKRFENSTLPSSKEGLLNVLINTFGVPAKRAPVALKVLVTSAEQAGFKRADPNRLVHPVPLGLLEKGVQPEAISIEKDEIRSQALDESPFYGATRGNVHPAISGFLQELPKASGNNKWNATEQQRWLDAFTAMIKAIYPAQETNKE